MVPEFHPVFLFLLSASTAPTYTATIIPPEPCALDAGIQLFVQSFIISY